MELNRKSETDLLCPDGFDAAIEAAQASEHAGGDNQEQLAAAIVAYCTYMTAAKISPLVGWHSVGTTCAQDIGNEKAGK